MNNIIGIDELRQIQLDILKKVALFCDQNNLRYFLAGGTLLGAIRHKGYIPWDDDIDIMMPRPDYEQFLKVFHAGNCSIISYHTDPDCIYPFAKIIDDRTVMIEDVVLKTKMGVYIDVFPIDGLPDSMEESKRFLRQLDPIRNKIMAKTVVLRRRKGLVKNILIFGAKIVYLFSNYRNNIIKLDKLCQQYSYQYSNFVGAFIFGYGIKERISKKSLENYILVDFEREKFRAQKGYDEYLSSIYGDYMQLPPEEKRKSHHFFKAYWK